MPRLLTEADGFVPLEREPRAPRVRPLSAADGFIPLNAEPQPVPEISPQLTVRPPPEAPDLADEIIPPLPALAPEYTAEPEPESYIGNVLRQFPARVAGLLGGTLSAGAGSDVVLPSGLPASPLAGLRGLGEQIASISDDVRNPYAEEVAQRVREGDYLGALAGVPAATPGVLAQSAADIIGLSRGLLPGYLQARGEEINRERIARGDDSVEGYLRANAGALVSVLLDRFGLDRVLKAFQPGGSNLLMGMLRGLFAEAPTEGAQEIVEYIAATAGTEEGASLQEALERGLTGALLGAGAGAGMGGAAALAGRAVQPERQPELGDLLLPDPGAILVDPEGGAATEGGRQTFEREQEAMGLTPDVVRAMHQRQQRELEEQTEAEVLADILGLPSPEVFAEEQERRDPLMVDPEGGVARRSEREAIESERAALGLTPDVERAAQARRERDAQVDEEPPLGDLLALPPPTEEPLEVDREGVAATARQRAEAERQRALERERLGLTPDVEQAGQVRREREQRALADELVPPQGMGPDRRQRDEPTLVDSRSGRDRRVDLERRKRVAQMTPEEMRRELLTSEVTGIGNRRAYEEAEKLPTQVSIDVDSLKAVNDLVSHEAGDELLRVVAEALAAETDQAYHISGDEFVSQALTEEEAVAVMERVRDRLARATVEATLPDGTTMTLEGVGISYGIGGTLSDADQRLQEQKREREASGLRAARGERPPNLKIRSPEDQADRRPAARDEDQDQAAASDASEVAAGARPDLPASAGSVDTDGAEPASDRLVTAGAQLFGDGSERETVAEKGLRSLDVDRQRVVASNVLAGLQDPEILRSVVESVPVDVVNMLTGKQFSTEDLLQDPSVLAERFPVPPDGPVPRRVVRVVDALARAVPAEESPPAGLVAEPVGEPEPARRTGEGSAALQAGAGDASSTGEVGVAGAAAEDVAAGEQGRGAAVERGSAVRAVDRGHEPDSTIDEQLDVGDVTISDETIRALEQLRTEIRERLKQVGISDVVAGEAVEEIIARTPSGQIVSARGAFRSRGRKLIRVALTSPHPTRTINHEIIHALRDLGLFTDAEWRTLVRAAKGHTEMWEAVQRRYRNAGLTQEQLEEEAVADLHGAWVEDQIEAKGALRRILERISDFFRAIRDVLRGHGFRTAEDVFRAIDRGEMGRRLRARTEEVDLGALQEQIVGYDERLDISEGDSDSAAPRQLSLDWDAHAVAGLSPEARRDLFDAVRQTRVENVQSDTIDAGLTHVSTPEDALRAINEFTDRAQENLVVVVARKDGKIIEVQRHSVGTVDASQVDPGVLVGAILDVPKAARVYLAHNHPSGSESLSQADTQLTDLIHELMTDTGVTLHGMLVGVPDGDTGSFYNPAGGAIQTIQASPSSGKVRTKVTERRYTQRRQGEIAALSSPAVTKSYIRNELPPDATGVILMDTQHRPVGFVPMTADDMRAVRKKAPGEKQTRKAQVLRALHSTNARAMIIVSKWGQPGAHNLARFLNSLAGSRLLDVVMRKDSGELTSSAEMGTPTVDSRGEYFDLDDDPDDRLRRRAEFALEDLQQQGFDTSTILYHGTTGTFDRFQPGSYFALDRRYAEDWIADVDERFGPHVREVVIRGRQYEAPRDEADLIFADPALLDSGERAQKEALLESIQEQGYSSVYSPINGGEVYVFDPADIADVSETIAFDLDEDPDERLRRKAEAANRRRAQRRAVRRQPLTPEQERAQQASPTTGGAVGWDFDRKRWEGMSGTLRRARAELQDKMLAWRDAQENIAQALGRTIPDAENVYRLETLMHGRVLEGLQRVEETQIVPLVKAIRAAKVDVAELEEYLYARHAKERNAQIASINPKMPDGGSGMTNAEADAILARADRAKLEPLARRVDTIIRKTRRRLLSQGLITQEQFDAMEAQYQHYVPLRGKAVEENEFGDMGGPAGRGIDTRARPVREALGRGAGNRAQNILGEIIGDAQRAVIQGEKARVGRAVLRIVRANPNPRLWEVEPVQTERRLNAAGEVYEAVVHDWSDPSIIAVREGGKLYRVQVKHVPLAKALNHVGVEQMSKITRMAGALNRYFSAILTRYNPAFVPVNAARDALFGLTGLAAEHGEVVAMEAALAYPKAARASWRQARRLPVKSEWDRFAREFAEDGGKTGYVHMPSVEDLQRKIGSGRLGSYDPQGIARAAKAVGDLVGAANDAVENALRLSSYVTLRKRGMSREAAAEYAKNITVNFNRKGFSGSALNAWFLFYNASIQGAKRATDVMRKPKTWGYLGTLAAAQVVSMMFAMGIEDDEGEPIWNKVPDYVKWRNLVFTWRDDDGEQHILSIPMPYGFNFFVWLSGRAGETVMQDVRRPQDTAANIAAEATSVFTQSFSPVPLDDGTLGLVPTALRIPIAVQVNRSDLGYRIRNENPYSQFDVPRSAIGRPDTLEIFKLASKGLNRLGGGDDYTPPPMSAFDLAPEDIRYLVEQFSGGAGKFVLDVATLGQIAAGEVPVTARDIPVTSRFFTTLDDRAAQQSLYYERREMIERAAERVRDTFVNEGQRAALELLKATPELSGADFQRYKKGDPRTGKAPGDVVLVDGRPRLVPKSPGSLYGRYKEAARVVAEQNEAIRNAYAASPPGLLPDRERDRKIREAADIRARAQRAFNRKWTESVSGAP